MDDETQGCCQSENFNLSHEPIDDFLTSQWQTSKISYNWLIYRWALAIFFIAASLFSSTQFWHGGLWLIYLTTWGFILCTIASTIGAILVTINHFQPGKFDDDSKVFKIYWVVHWSALVMAETISFIFWVYFPKYFPSMGSTLTEDLTFNINTICRHGCNAIFMLLDHMLVAFPTRLLHLIYPMCFGAAYILFTFIYYVAGGLDMHGHRYIYIVLDWSNPETAAKAIAIAYLITVTIGVLLFGLFKLRVVIYSKLKT